MLKVPIDSQSFISYLTSIASNIVSLTVLRVVDNVSITLAG